MPDNIKAQARAAMEELLELADVRPGGLIVVGCSTSEVIGEKIGKGSSPDTAKEIVESIMPLLEEKGYALAAQCCEHLNRALIVERATAEKLGLEIVSVRPMPKAGGSFATAVYERMADPVAVEFVRADAGLDIGCTMIGMHLKHVAVPLRLQNNRIGEALVLAARTRPKLIGGDRACYN